VIAPVLVPVLKVGFEPAQPSLPVPPVAAQVLAPLVDHARLADCPTAMVDGVAVNALMVGADGVALATLTTTELGLPAPPGPVQLKVKT